VVTLKPVFIRGYHAHYGGKSVVPSPNVPVTCPIARLEWVALPETSDNSSGSAGAIIAT